MDNKNNKDAFTNINLGGGDKYLKRHQDAVKVERAELADKRIAEFLARKHDLNWAKEAYAFCDREEENGKDLLDISKGIQDLARIRREATDILVAEENRIKEEQEKQKLAFKTEQERLKLLAEEEKIKADAEKEKQRLLKEQQELELKKERDRLRLLAEEERIKTEKLEDEQVVQLEKNITTLQNASRNRQWLKDLDNLGLNLKGQSKRVYERISNRFIFESLVEESKDVETALDLNDEIIELNATRLKNKPWAERVFNVEKRLNKKYDKYMTDKNTFYTMATFATKIYYGDKIANVESVINKAEADNLEEALVDYYVAVGDVDNLRNAIYIEEYIENFEKRWKTAQDKIDAYAIKKDKDEADRKRAEKERKEIQRKKEIEEKERRKREELEQKEKTRIAIETKARKAAIAKRRRKAIFKFVLVVLELALISAPIVFGVLNYNTTLGKNILTIGGSCVAGYIIFRQSILFREIDILRVVITQILNTALLVFGIVSMCNPMLNGFSIPCFSALAVTSFLNMILISTNLYGSDVDDSVMSYYWFNLALIGLAFAFINFTVVPEIIRYVICAGVLIVASIISVVMSSLYLVETDALMYFVGSAMVIAGIVLCFFPSWSFYILAGGLAVGGLVHCFGNKEFGEDFVPFTIFLIFAVIAMFLLGLVTKNFGV